MARVPAGQTMWPSGRLDPRTRVLADGAWAGLAGAAVAFVAVLIGRTGAEVASAAQVAASGLALGAVLVALGVPFAWVTRLVGAPLLPAGLVYGALVCVATGARDAAGVVPLLLYGATLGLTLRHLRAR